LIAADRFRHVGHLATGVTVITAYGLDGPSGMAANSVTSVSLDPPLVLFCPAKSSTTWPRLRTAGGFCINVMAGHHEEVTRRFASKAQTASPASAPPIDRPAPPWTTRLPGSNANDASRRPIALDESRGRSLHADTILVPAIQAQPGDVCGAIVVAIHRFPQATAPTTG